MARNDPQVNLRIPEQLKESLEWMASENKRSLTQEIVSRLEESFSAKKGIAEALGNEASFIFARLHADIAQRDVEAAIDAMQKRVLAENLIALVDTLEESYGAEAVVPWSAVRGLARRVVAVTEEGDSHLENAKAKWERQREHVLNLQNKLAEKVLVMSSDPKVAARDLFSRIEQNANAASEKPGKRVRRKLDE